MSPTARRHSRGRPGLHHAEQRVVPAVTGLPDPEAARAERRREQYSSARYMLVSPRPSYCIAALSWPHLQPRSRPPLAWHSHARRVIRERRPLDDGLHPHVVGDRSRFNRAQPLEDRRSLAETGRSVTLLWHTLRPGQVQILVGLAKSRGDAVHHPSGSPSVLAVRHSGCLRGRFDSASGSPGPSAYARMSSRTRLRRGNPTQPPSAVGLTDWRLAEEFARDATRSLDLQAPVAGPHALRDFGRTSDPWRINHITSKPSDDSKDSSLQHALGGSW